MAPLPRELIERVKQLLARGGRVLGIAGPPGAGKSTLAAAVVQAFGTRAALLPMDGFHLADEELQRLGRAGRKGAPDTFDVHGYRTALGRVRDRQHDVLVPRFDRHLEAAIAGAIRIATTTELVVTDGNYLLLADGPWAGVASMLDETWMLRPDDDHRRQQLVARHVAHGRSSAAAADWVATVDEPNAALIIAGSRPADVVVSNW